MKLWRYTTRDIDWGNTTTNPGNGNPNPNAYKYYQYKYDGAYNITSVPPSYFAPLIVTKPYFLDAPELYETVGAKMCNPIGQCRPNRTRDDITVDIEPKTGTVMRASQFFQVNVEMQPLKNMTGGFPLENDEWTHYPTTLVPIAIVGQEGIALDSQFDQIALALMVPSISLIGGLSLGSLMTLLGVWMCCKNRTDRHRYNEIANSPTGPSGGKTARSPY